MKRVLCIIIMFLFAAWLTVGIVDFVRINSFEKPFFCIATQSADDGGSGKYIGLGYSFDIKGNFLPDDEFPGITSFTARIFGIEILSGVRD